MWHGLANNSGNLSRGAGVRVQVHAVIDGALVAHAPHVVVAVVPHGFSELGIDRVLNGTWIAQPPADNLSLVNVQWCKV